MGFRVVEALLRERVPPTLARFGGRFSSLRLADLEVSLLRPETYMNRSGSSVCEAVTALALEDLASDLVVVYDDLDLPFGRLRVRASGGAGGHRGIGDIIECLESRDFARIRFGIGRPPEDGDPVAYVLAPFSQEEEEALPDLIQTAVDCLESVLRSGVTAAMNQFNRSPEIE